jgi:tetratricopeptide (TPR) repeat protein
VAETSSGSTGRRRPKGIDLKPDSIRTARTEAGLSLADLAGAELSRAAVHLIETGQARPALAHVERMAKLTGKPLTYFVSDEDVLSYRGERMDDLNLRVSRLEATYERGDYNDGVTDARKLLSAVLGLAAETQVRYWLARGLNLTGEPAQAEIQIDLALATVDPNEDPYLMAECLDCKAGALYLQQDPRALSCARDAMALTERVTPAPLRLQSSIASHIAAIHLAEHEWSAAVDAYTLAVEHAGNLHDLRRMAQMYDGLSLAYQGMGEGSKALGYSHRAIALYGQLTDRLSLASAENNLGYLLVRQGELGAAEPHLQKSLRLFEEAGVVIRKSQVLLSLAELELQRQNVASAASLAREGLTLSMSLHERANTALAHAILGRASEVDGHPEDADHHLMKAISILRDIPSPERLLGIHTDYAKILEGRGDHAAASHHWKAALAISRPTLVEEAAVGETGLSLG